jgi:transcriptional regulator with XRE-family HTH domain
MNILINNSERWYIMKYNKTRRLDNREKKALISDIDNKVISSFAINFLECIDEKGVSFDELHEETGISKGSFSAYKKGTTVPSILVINKLADYFGVSTDYLLGRTSIKKPDFDHVGIEKMLGLSEKAIERLMEIKSFCVESEDFEILNVVNELFVNNKSKDFFSAIMDYIYPKRYLDKVKFVSKVKTGDEEPKDINEQDYMVELQSLNESRIVEIEKLTLIIARSKITEVNEILHSISDDIKERKK